MSRTLLAFPFRLVMRFAAVWVVLVFSLGSRPANGAEWLYVSMSDSTIRRYDISLSTSGDIAASGQIFVNTGQGLKVPAGLAFDSSGNLYAANNGNSTITRYSSSGAYSGTPFVPAAQGLSSPIGLAIDSSGYLYAANYGNKTISKIDNAGTVLFSWSTPVNPFFLAIAPEPSVWILGGLATGVMALLARRRRAKRLA